MTVVGRADELRVLIALIDRAGEHGGAIVVLGEPGIGKSSLLRVAEEHARARGQRVLETTGVQAETRLPFAGLHHVLRPVLDTVGVLPAAQRGALQSALGVEDGPPAEPFLAAVRGNGTSGFEPGVLPLTDRLERAFTRPRRRASHTRSGRGARRGGRLGR